MVGEREKNTKYFYRLEKQKYNQRAMSCLIREDGSISCNQKGILKMQAAYYWNLYMSDPDVEFTFMKDVTTLNKLSSKEKEITNRLLTLEEITHSLHNLRRSRSPGCDGLSPEFLLMFWDKLGKKTTGYVYFFV